MAPLPKKKKIEIKEREKPLPVTMDPGGISASKDVKTKTGNVNIGVRKSLTNKSASASLGGSFETSKGSTIGGYIDTQKNINLDYTSPKGRSFSVSKESGGPVAASYTAPSGKGISGYYQKGGNYGVSLNTPMGQLSYDSDKNVGASFRKGGNLISARYNMADKTGEVSARIPIRKRRK